MSMHNPDLNKSLNHYYSNKIETLMDIFGTKDVVLAKQCITINGHSFPIVDDVIVLLNTSQWLTHPVAAWLFQYRLNIKRFLIL